MHSRRKGRSARRVSARFEERGPWEGFAGKANPSASRYQSRILVRSTRTGDPRVATGRTFGCGRAHRAPHFAAACWPSHGHRDGASGRSLCRRPGTLTTHGIARGAFRGDVYRGRLLAHACWRCAPLPCRSRRRSLRASIGSLRSSTPGPARTSTTPLLSSRSWAMRRIRFTSKPPLRRSSGRWPTRCRSCCAGFTAGRPMRAISCCTCSLSCVLVGRPAGCRW